MKKKQRHRIVEGQGDPCVRCGQPTEIREHVEITERHLAQPFYYSRWFYCVDASCRTTLIMPDRFRVFRNREENLRVERIDQIQDQLKERGL